MKIPEGWKLVPVEPTEDIMYALTGSDNWDVASRLWQSALEAAPTSPATIPLETLVAEMESDPETKVALNEARKKDMLEGATVTELTLPAQEPRLVSYGLNLETCTLNYQGEEYYFERTSTTAQEVEPVAFIDTFNNRLIWPDQIVTNSEGRMKSLYAAPQDDKLRKAAEEFVAFFNGEPHSVDDILSLVDEHEQRLRDALEEK